MQLLLFYTLENEGIQSSIFKINIIQPQVLHVTFSGLPKGQATQRNGYKSSSKQPRSYLVGAARLRLSSDFP